DLWAESIGRGDVRGDARGAAGRACDHERDPQYSAGVFEVGANSSAVEMADYSDGAFPGHASRGDRGSADRLLSDAARGASGRDVRRESWIRLSHHQPHSSTSGRTDDYYSSTPIYFSTTH